MEWMKENQENIYKNLKREDTAFDESVLGSVCSTEIIWYLAHKDVVLNMVKN